MKNKILFFIFFAVCGLVSCKKYLNETPTASFGEDYVFGSVGNAKAAVLGVYNRLTGDLSYGGRLSYYFASDNDETLGTVNNGVGGGDNATKAIARYNATPLNVELDRVYNQMFQGVERANICIKAIPQMNLYTNGTDDQKRELKRLHGEALTLRAQFYFDLMKHWGDVPAAFEPSTDEASFLIGKTNRDEIYDHIIADLKTAEDLVPWRGDPGVTADERITKGAVKALRARLALFRGGYSLRADTRKMERRPDFLKYYQIARDECKEIMDAKRHALNTSYQAVFKDNMDAHRIEPNGEVLFEIAMAGGDGNSDGRVGYIDGIQVNKKGSGNIIIMPTYFYAFDSLDVRRDVTIASYAIDGNGYKFAYQNAGFVGLLLAKFRRDWISNPVVLPTSDAAYFGINWPLIRYSDVLLMFAEADNEINNGPTAEAIQAFKDVRGRAFNGDLSKIGIIPSDKQGFFTSIVNERSFELGGEAIRKYDLIRWNLLYDKILQTRANLEKMRTKQAPYASLPQIMYFKQSSPDLIYANSYYQPTPAKIPVGYVSANWIRTLGLDYIKMVAEVFEPNKKELLPLSKAVIDANPKLKQDYGY
ncbi:RagB/SusD family nutrient uptake outer membrane protein [Pedobacter hiemivivus]|uniref:RagB/SusD family nutrient uptake outer membrane protein n=1 Tax=Pedobacter hiemivivus TaxID=2530454 RepID=A0A4U1G4H0_9SPHI|nr:RagB/SusD family nutrient uptake outer membrane protein [Pedobacter hiemivivus]TKC58505.1 RagB/SusD family nutrient uptake outer membrane protein [Pedobacter hiemivivus]